MKRESTVGSTYISDVVAAEHSDAELITAVRAGDESAFGTLWSRHESAARRLARQIGNPSNADDLVSEAFYRVLRALKAGSGPDGAFRPYLFSTLRRINIDNGRSYYTRVSLTDDDNLLEQEHGDSAADVLIENADSSAAWRAWSSLPDSTRTLLWHLIIEEETPAQIAPLVGTTPNGVSSRAVRAKERLRQAFLQQHLLDAETENCRQARRRLGEYIRDALSARDRTEVQAHLDDCASCRAALFEVTDINQTMKAVIAPVVLGGALLAGYYLAAAGTTAGAGKVAIIGRVTMHHLRNPAVAAGVAGAVIVAGIGSAFAIHAVDTGNTAPPKHSVVAAAAAGLAPPTALPVSSASSSTPTQTPTSITPTVTPPAPTVKATIKHSKVAPVVPRTTPKAAPVVLPSLTASLTPTPTPPVTPPPATQAVVITEVPPAPSTGTLTFTWSGAGWTILNVVPPVGYGACTMTSSTVWTCGLDSVTGDSLNYEIDLNDNSSPLAGTLSWVLNDNSGYSASCSQPFPGAPASCP